MSRGMSRAQRLKTMEMLYMERAYTDQEMADELGVRRETIYQDRIELETDDEIPFVEIEHGRRRIDRTKYLPNIKVNLHEALALYLAMRRVSRQTRTAQPHVQRALEKLALTLKQPMTERLILVASQLAQQPADPNRVKVMEDLAQGWSLRQKVRIHYNALSGSDEKIHTISPYLIEPSNWSDAIYAIAQSDRMSKPTPFNVARITQTFVTSETFELPEDFDEQELLRYAWGIWTRDRAPEMVKLKFTGTEAIKRVKETIWHPLQKDLVATPDGALLWEAPIAEWQEMLPWIRGWGASVEVLEPKELRETLMGEVRRMTKVYGIAETKPMPKHWLLWAKTNRPQNTKLHLLICHLIDVGNVAKVMWERVFTNEFKQQITDALNLKNPDDAGRLISFITAMHDLGKACPYFQAHIRNKPALRSHYEEIKARFEFPDNKESCLHGFVSTAALVDLLQSTLKMPSELAIPIAIAVGGHHGRWPRSDKWGDQLVRAGVNEWKQAREKLVADVKEVFAPPNVTQYALDQETQNMLLVALSGITSVTDWLGSMENHFGYRNEIADLDDYANWSLGKAQETLDKEHWTDWRPTAEPMSFIEQFKHARITEPRGAQPFAIELAEKLDKPSLVIIEDATGSGKTEAAWYLADHWTRVLGNRGVYVAMPTMATSNSLHDRVTKFLETRYPHQKIEPILVHSQARYAEDDAERKMQSNDEADQASKGSDVNALAWFEDKRKRSLLAPFGVGTVDQTFLSVLQTNHFFVRLFALGRKTVIFDEVHAYDTYMTEIFQTLLRWLRVMGSSTIILSATLPVATRRKLVEAYGGDASKASNAEASSVVTWVSDTMTEQKLLPLVERSPLRVEWIEHSPEAIASELRNRMGRGGCVAVICNRVARAQEVYSAIKEAFKGDARFIPGDNLLLFHARFPMIWRDEIEKRVRKQADKNSTRTSPFIVVATQVIEQSLDLDFDLMITDLPPIDLLIQRVGRLHRHKEHDGLRPGTMKTPRVLITKPEKEGEVPRFGKDEYVYSYYVLLRTWLELKSRERDDTLVLELPKQTRELIEAVYVEGKPNLDSTPFTDNQKSAAIESWKKMRRSDEEDRRKANLRTIDDPGSESLITMDNLELSDDESPQAQEGLSAMTRLCLPSVQLVCVIETAAGLVVLEQREVVDLKQKPNPKLAKGLVRCTVTITRPNVYRHFVAQKAPDGWLEHALLKNYRVAKFAPDSNGEYVCSLTQNLSLRLSKERGIEIMQNEERK